MTRNRGDFQCRFTIGDLVRVHGRRAESIVTGVVFRKAQVMYEVDGRFRYSWEVNEPFVDVKENQS